MPYFTFRTFFTLLILFTYCGFAAAQSSEINATETKSTPPNIVFIFTDDLGYGDIGAFGATDIKTPHIDSIARNGAKFTQFYSASPVCTPSRAALLTGRYPVRMGIHHVFFPGSYAGMPEDELTIAELLKEQDYATGIIGKWHLGHRAEFLPLNQGFDEYFGIPYSNDMSPLPMMRGNEFIEAKIDQTQLTRRLTEEAVDFIERKANRPFFLYLSHPMPHVPLFRSENFESVSERGLYGDVIEELDWSVGEILAVLKRHNLTQNTLIVFTSDNGPWIMMGDKAGSSGGLRQGKGTTFEGGVRVPTVAQYPDLISPETMVETPLSMLDWFPTLAGLAGAELPQDGVLDGHTLSFSFEQQPDDRVLAFYAHGQLQAIRVGDWKLKRPFDANNIPIPGLLRAFIKGEFAQKSHDTLLFNLKTDPGETKNLATTNPAQLVFMQEKFDAFEAQMRDMPPSLTDLELVVNPVIAVLMKAGVKIALIALSTLLLLVFSLAFWFGRRSRRRASKKG